MRKSYTALYEASLELVETTLAECMAAGHLAHDDAHELAVTVKALEEGYDPETVYNAPASHLAALLGIDVFTFLTPTNKNEVRFSPPIPRAYGLRVTYDF